MQKSPYYARISSLGLGLAIQMEILVEIVLVVGHGAVPIPATSSVINAAPGTVALGRDTVQWYRMR